MASTRGRRPASEKSPEASPMAAVLPWSAAAFFFLLPLVFTTAGLDTFRLPKAAFAAAAIPWILTVFVLTRRLRTASGWVRSWEGLLVVGLAFAAGHAMLVGGRSLSGWATLSVFLYSALLIAIRAGVDRRQQRTVWWALLGALSINAVLAVLQYYQLLGEWGTDVGRTLGGRFTPAGLIGNVNTGGFLFVIGALMLTALAWTARTTRERLCATLLLVIQLVALAHTRTITALVVLVLCGGAALAFQFWRMARRGPTRAGPRSELQFIAAVVVAAGLGLGLLSYTGTLARASRAVEHYHEGNWQRLASGRLPLFQVTWGLVEEAPLAGRGLAAFPREFFDFKVRDEQARTIRLAGHQGAFREAHNEYLQVWVELGLAGFFLFVALLGWPLWMAGRRLVSETDPDEACWIALLALSLVATAISSLTFFPFHLATTAAVIVLVLACLLHRLSDSVTAEPRTAAQSVSLFRRPQTASVIGVLVLASCLNTLHQSRRWRANGELSIAAGILENVAARRVAANASAAFVAEAQRRISKAEGWDPANYESRPLRGTAAFLGGRYDLAVEAYREAALFLPSPEVFTNLAAAHLARNELVEARQAVETALAYNPRYDRALQALQHLEARERQ